MNLASGTHGKPEVKDKDFHLFLLGTIQNALGLFMNYVDRQYQAVFHLTKAIKISRDIGDSTYLAVYTNNLGIIYVRSLNMPDSALQMARAAESILLKKRDEKRLAYVYWVMGMSFKAKHNDSLALVYLYKGIALSKKYDLQDLLALDYRHLADLYLKEYNQDSSLYYAQAAAKIHISVSPMDFGEDFENLSKSYELNQRQDSAYKYQRIALTTYDSLYKNRIKGLTGFQQLAFDQQQHLRQLKAEKTATQNKIRIYILLAGIAVILLVSFFIYRNSRQQKKANSKIQKAYNELKATQAQLIQSEKMASLV